MKLLPQQPKRARVEMTPIMDVVFLLLVFFVYAILRMTVQKGVHVELPRADGQATEKQTLRVVITETNTLLLDGRTPMSEDEIVDALATRYEALQLPVVIALDRKAHAGPAVELLAKLRAKGIAKIVYQVDQKQTATTP